MFPLLPSKIPPEIEEQGLRLIQESAALGHGLHPKLVQSIATFMLAVNSYYTNAMEGNPSKLKDIEAALRKDFLQNPAARNFQLEHVAHIKTQQDMLDRLRAEPNLDICSTEFLSWIHRTFYERLPHEMHFVQTVSGKLEPVYPGELRDRGLTVGKHIPPETKVEVEKCLRDFAQILSPQRVKVSLRYAAFASSHHRLLWIHPFRDGNGRVARLFTIAYQYRLGVDSGGLWTVTRAFGRKRGDYDRFLEAADGPRHGDWDGRGPLSEEGLMDFCRYFFGECLDQIQYMKEQLELSVFEKRFMRHVRALKSDRTISKAASQLLEELFYRGSIPRGDVQQICGVQRRRATTIIQELLQKALVTSSSRQGELRLLLSAEMAGVLFPKLV